MTKRRTSVRPAPDGEPAEVIAETGSSVVDPAGDVADVDPPTADIPAPVAVPTELRWNGQPLRVHASRELAQADLDDCHKRRHQDVTRALGAHHEHHAAHVGEFTLHDVPPPPAAAAPEVAPEPDAAVPSPTDV